MAASYVRIGQDDIASNFLAEVVVEQRLNSHWTCQVTYRATLDSRPEVEQMHGQPLRIATLSLDGTEHVIFSGIIRSASLGHEVWGSYTAQVEAVSLCWLMDLGEHHAYFLKQAPQQIAQTLTGAPGLALAGTIEGDATASRVQWAETDYDFLLQLVDDGEAWLRPTEQGVEIQTSFQAGVTVQWREGEYGLLEFETAGRVTPSRIDGAHYDPVTMNSQHYAAVQSDAVFYPDAVPQLVGKTLAASSASTTAAHPARNRAITLDHYQQRLQLESRRAAVNAVTCKGISREPQVTAGNEIVIAGLPGAAGTFGVIACTHRWTSKGYENHFTATPAKRWFAPVRASRSTASGLYPARIAANHDPHNQGRMQIQYWWLDDSPTTWARLLTAHAGADRGILWYPEMGDEVAVRFEQGDPERPVIVGSVWNGVHQPPTQGYWHTGKPNDVEFASNNIKRIVTKSGIRITLNDTPGQETISLATPTSNQVTMTEKTNETGRPALLLHTTGDILVNATGRIHANSATHSREVGASGAQSGAVAAASSVPALNPNLPEKDYDGVLVGKNCQPLTTQSKAGDGLTKDQINTAWKSAYVSNSPCCQKMRDAGKAPTKIVYVNGIKTDRPGQCVTLQKIANMTCAPVIGVHNATDGQFKDLWQSHEDKNLIDKAREGKPFPTHDGRNPAVDSMTDVMNNSVRSSDPTIFWAHSQGGDILSLASYVSNLELVRYGIPQGVSGVQATTMASAGQSYPSALSAEHYINIQDFVPTKLGLGKDPATDAANTGPTQQVFRFQGSPGDSSPTFLSDQDMKNMLHKQVVGENDRDFIEYEDDSPSVSLTDYHDVDTTYLNAYKAKHGGC